MIIKTLTLTDFVHEFGVCGRSEQFSDEALEYLFNYYEDYYDEFEMDVIAICCDWCETDDLEEIDYYDELRDRYDEDEWEDLDDDEKSELLVDYLQSQGITAYQLASNSILYQNY